MKRLVSKSIIADLDSDILLGLENESPSITTMGRMPKTPIGLGYNPNTENLPIIYNSEVLSLKKQETLKFFDTNKTDYIYDRVASSYEGIVLSPEVHANLISYVLRLFSQHRITSGTVLDVGCGPGNLKRALNNNFIFTGVDISSKMLEEARKNNYEIIEGDMQKILANIPNKSFDYVISLSALQFVSDPINVINEFDRIARNAWVISIDNITPKMQKHYLNNEKLRMYNHFLVPVNCKAEEIYFSGWRSPITDEVIVSRMVFKKL